jgi:peptide/nickel transport system substrate-binding protein
VRFACGVPGIPVPIAVGRYVVNLLGRLGYRSSLLVVPGSKYLGYVFDTRHKAQIGLLGWIADRLIPSNFLDPIMSCASFIPNSTRNSNPLGYCNPSVDARVREAAGLQVSDPVRADSLWAPIDRTLTDQAVALGNTRGAVLVSARVGNYVNHPLSGTLLDQLWVR